MRKFIAYPVDSARDPYVVVRLEQPKPSPWQIKVEAARLFRKAGTDIAPEDIDFHSV